MSDQRWRITRWNSLECWLDYAHAIDQRRFAAATYAAVDRHWSLFPMDLVSLELDRPLLRAVLEMMEFSGSRFFQRPIRGMRAGHPTTEITMRVRNQLARLDRDRSNAA